MSENNQIYSRILVHGTVMYSLKDKPEQTGEVSLNIIANAGFDEYVSMKDISKIHRALSDTVIKQSKEASIEIEVNNVVINNIMHLGDSNDEQFYGE